MAKAIDPTALTARQLADVLSKAAGGAAPKLTVKQIQADLAAGAPTNADGTVHLVRYTAWLVSQAR